MLVGGKDSKPSRQGRQLFLQIIRAEKGRHLSRRRKLIVDFGDILL
jgi:hypothetical protein